jgi:hypothetical protein
MSALRGLAHEPDQVLAALLWHWDGQDATIRLSRRVRGPTVSLGQ